MRGRAPRSCSVSSIRERWPLTERMRKVRWLGAPIPGMGDGSTPISTRRSAGGSGRLTVQKMSGRIGVVLPRSALAAKGTTHFRQTVFGESEQVEVTMLLNRAGWVFDEAEHRYTIGLVCIAHGAPRRENRSTCGVPTRRGSSFDAGDRQGTGGVLQRRCPRNWNDSASLPLLPSEESVGVFAQLRRGTQARPGTCPSSMAGATGPAGLVNASLAEAPHGPRERGVPRRVLAGLQGGVLRFVDCGYRHLLRLGGSGTGAQVDSVQKRLRAGKSRRR